MVVAVGFSSDLRPENVYVALNHPNTRAQHRNTHTASRDHQPSHHFTVAGGLCRHRRGVVICERQQRTMTAKCALPLTKTQQQQCRGSSVTKDKSDVAAPSNDWVAVAKGGWEREVAATGGKEMGVAAGKECIRRVTAESFL
ncbi:unnamed protein product [Lactuca saligna]|uniref:Uncharacterized protein n=1 Tax=Lactuca saligna TaxID=75948 RepID=A0AA35ZNT5_LACSI|nr:unnamed protein product [Lactuca saligna]